MANKINKQIFIIPAAVLLLITAAMVYIYLTQETISKPDPASENIIRHAAAEVYFTLTLINKDPNSLTDEDFAKITELTIWKKEISDIKLLEKFTNLKSLSIADIKYPTKNIPKWMQLLAKVGVFNLEERFTLDLSPLANLTNLNYLVIAKTQISDVKSIANLTNLGLLEISYTQISDIKPLANLTNLQFLRITEKKVTDIRPLANLKKLNTLGISGSNAGDEQIAELKKALPNTTFE